MATALNLTLLTTQQGSGSVAKVHPEGTVYFVLDTSGSMAGSKIAQVIHSMKTMIAKAPNYLRFCVRVFNTDVKLLVTKKKKYLEIPRLEAGIKRTVGSLTALYDAWGQTLSEIPYSDSKLDLVHVIIFTDGGDNCSKTYNLSKVIDMSKDKVKGDNMKLSFIQAGATSPSCTAVKGLDPSKFTTYNVEDSAAGIQFAFGKVDTVIQQQLTLQLNLNVTINSASGIDQLTRGIGRLGMGNNAIRMTVNPPQQRGQGPLAIRPAPAPRSSAPGAQSHQNYTPKPKASASKQFPIKIENIPAIVTEKELRQHFQQWGQCELKTLVPAGKNTQFAIISYLTENSQRFAVRHAGSSGFKGHFLVPSVL